jgi:hypothetical protein
MQRRFTLVTLFSVAIVIPALYQAPKAHATAVQPHNRGCSVASLNGTYAFRRTGVNNVLGGPIAQIGIEVFNGDGTRGSIRTTRSSNGDIRDWTDESPSGSYTVDPDCTGSFFDADGTKTHNLIVLGKGRGYFLLSVAPDTITTQEGEKIEGERLEVEQ